MMVIKLEYLLFDVVELAHYQAVYLGEVQQLALNATHRNCLDLVQTARADHNQVDVTAPAKSSNTVSWIATADSSLNIFRPGFSTKKYGWGLGLSLAKRIISDFHKGKIFVKESIIGSGTTIRIIIR